ncbi:MAG: isocitrate lyase/phosphoenolpyruvate mutase family protein [Actinomycetota bacterium]
MTTDIGAQFRALHKPGEPFILANAWDAGSAKMLAALGAQAIGTSSAAHAFTLGRPDGGLVARDEALAHAADLAAATPLPVSGDFENGFGDAPDVVAETVRLSADAGLAGISIEDTEFPSGQSYGFEAAVERITAAVEAAKAVPGDFVLLARADGVMLGNYDTDEAIRRIQAYEQAGADAVYVPLPPDMSELARVCQSVSIPVNALAAGPFTEVPYTAFAEAGVARISLGSALARLTHRVIHDAATAMFERGDFSPLGNGIGGGTIDRLLTHEASGGQSESS